MLGVVATLLAGCDQLWSLPQIDETSIDAGNVPLDGVDGMQLACPVGYDLQSTVSPSRYRYLAANVAWDAARMQCEAHDPGRTHLVVLTDEAERIDVRALLAGIGVRNTFWIGLSDRRLESTFLWVTDEAVGMPPFSSPPWGAGQPDDSGGAQDCVRIEGDEHADPGMFDDSGCGFGYPYLCECDGIPPAPMNF
jgi:hypothetical protein